MKKILLIILFFLPEIFSQTINDVAAIEGKKFQRTFHQNKLNYPGDSTLNVIYYKLNLEVSYSPQYLNGVVTVAGSSMIDGLSSFFLDLSNVLTVDSVKSGDKKLIYEHSQDILTIQTDHPYQKNEMLNATVYYQGTPQTTGLGSFTFDTHNGQPSIWTLSEPYGASDWWPCKDTPADKADSADIWVTCDSKLFAVSNGKLVETIDNLNGTFTYKWESRYPIANYLISLAISEFTSYRQYFKYSPNDSMPVVHYIYPEVFPDVKEQLDKTTLMLEIFSDKFGLYPFIKEKYGHASFGRGGMEHQTISSMGAFNDAVISHELAHQWFGNKVTCKDWSHIWLNEGFATFGEGIYHEIVEGKESYNSYLSTTMSYAKTAKGSIFVRDVSLISNIFNGPRSYAKGAVVLHMLRGITGDSLFFRILKNYLNDPELSYRVAAIEDFQRIAEEVYGSSLEYFFREWIYGENYPHYNLKWNYTQIDNNLYKINLNVDQAYNSNPLFFTMPLQIKISTSVLDTLITIFNNQQIQSFTFNLEGEPKDFVFDPNNFVLDDSFIEDPYNLQIPQKFNLLQNFPNPFNNTTTITFQTSVRGRVIIKIFDILGNEIETIFNDDVEANEYEINFNASSLGSGIYFYRMQAGEFVDTNKLVLLK